MFDVSEFKAEVRKINERLGRVIELLEQVVELLEDHQEPPRSYTYQVPSEGWGGEDDEFIG